MESGSPPDDICVDGVNIITITAGSELYKIRDCPATLFSGHIDDKNRTACYKRLCRDEEVCRIVQPPDATVR